MRKKKIIRGRSEEETNPQTGEIKRENFRYGYDIKIDDNFIKFYKEGYPVICKLPEKARKVFDYFVCGIEYGTNKFSISSNDKALLKQKYGVSSSAINKKISQLIKFKVFIKIGNGHYLINPFLCGYGDGKSNDKLRSEYPGNIITMSKEIDSYNEKRNRVFKKKDNGTEETNSIHG